MKLIYDLASKCRRRRLSASKNAIVSFYPNLPKRGQEYWTQPFLLQLFCLICLLAPPIEESIVYGHIEETWQPDLATNVPPYLLREGALHEEVPYYFKISEHRVGKSNYLASPCIAINPSSIFYFLPATTRRICVYPVPKSSIQARLIPKIVLPMNCMAYADFAVYMPLADHRRRIVSSAPSWITSPALWSTSHTHIYSWSNCIVTFRGYLRSKHYWLLPQESICSSFWSAWKGLGLDISTADLLSSWIPKILPFVHLQLLPWWRPRTVHNRWGRRGSYPRFFRACPLVPEPRANIASAIVKISRSNVVPSKSVSMHITTYGSRSLLQNLNSEISTKWMNWWREVQPRSKIQSQCATSVC